MRTTLVGREKETAHLRRLVRRTATGRGAILLVDGEPGIGRSALLAVAAAEARRAGARILRGQGIPADPAPPFATVRSWLDGEPAGGDFAVTEAVLNRVDGWCAASPVVVLVDDLQWADPSSLVLLGRLGRNAGDRRLLLVAAYRSAPRDKRVEALLRGLQRRGAERMTLAALSEKDVGTLAGGLLGAPPGPDLRNVLAGAGGNPRYAMELLGALARSGRIEVTGGVAGLRGGTVRPALPGTVLDLVRQRIEELSPGTRDMVRAAAVLGPGFDLTELAAVLGQPVISLWQPVSEAVAAGLLVDAGGQLVFRHDVVRRVLTGDVSADAAEALRLRAGRALATAGARVERVARYLTTATDLAPDLVDWLARTAEALVARAPELATPLLERTLAQRTADAPEILRVQYARALLWAGRPVEAQRAAQAALPAGDTVPPAERTGTAPPAGDTVPPADPREVALRWLLAQAHLQSGRVDSAHAVAEEVLATIRLPAGEAARFHGLAALCLLLSGRVTAAEAAVDRAGPTSDGYGTAHALTVRAGARLARQRPGEALDLADRAVAALGGDQVQPDHPFAPHLIRALCLTELDRFTEADAACGDGRAGGGHGGRTFLTWHHLAGARANYLHGRWDDALAEIRAGLGAADCLGVAEGLHSQAALIAIHRGEPDTYAEALVRPDANPHWGWLRRAARALAWEREGDPERALQALFDAWTREPARTCLAADVARLAAGTGERVRARTVAETVERITAHHGAAHVRATVALCRGVAGVDPTLLLAAAEAFAEGGRPLYEGYAYEEAAVALAAGNPVRARSALDSAVGCYERLGATWDADRAQARLRSAGIRRRYARRRPKTGWDALTNTERRIVTLVVAGRSNPDIAAELYLSRRTVRNHVSHILAKLGLSSRVELAVSAYENGAR
ncbi:helix-turn-helix transcriptional regulator [Planosporangium sp. 12N6]|uniref:helix-turn-helix transcriptional regulator n=1 Tax=Planosporangium spinosum TaxID=3402278 RepID=UPI003CE8A032